MRFGSGSETGKLGTWSMSLPSLPAEQMTSVPALLANWIACWRSGVFDGPLSDMLMTFAPLAAA
jgi:hypothetical protein